MFVSELQPYDRVCLFFSRQWLNTWREILVLPCFILLRFAPFSKISRHGKGKEISAVFGNGGMFFFLPRKKYGRLDLTRSWGVVVGNMDHTRKLFFKSFKLEMWCRYEKRKRYHAVKNHLEHHFACFRFPMS